MSVSVLVPVYGVEKYIEKCAHSLFSQTMKTGIEFIFVNDCSADNSIPILIKIVEEYPKRKNQVKVLHHAVNKGVARARQTAIDAASGNFILFVDADDFIEPDTVDTLYKKAIETNADITLCPFWYKYENGKKIANFEVLQATNKKEILQLALSTQAMFWNKLIKRSILSENNIQMYPSVNYGDDLAVVPQIIYYSTIFAKVEKALYHYVLYNQTSVTQSFSEESIQQSLTVVNILSDFFQKKPDGEDYKNEILLLKAVRKAKIIRNGILKKEYLELFPEITPFITKLNLDLKTKIILQLAAKGQFFLLKLFVSVLLFKKNSR
jgi:glycosyltransferase involved in cell wall biosynthesis